MKIWITVITAILCIGFLVFGNNHYHAEVEKTRAEAFKQYTDDQDNSSKRKAELEKERKSISGQQQKKLTEAHKVIQKVYDDSKHQSSELKEVLENLTPLIKQKEN